MPNQTNLSIETLTEREHDVLLAIAEGMSNQQIANSLHIALATVKWYNTQIYSKLDVSNRNDAVDKAQALGLLETEKTAVDIPNNLPEDHTPFVGRTHELTELHMLINQADTRLLTIIAQGGMGKTRLAVQLGRHQLLSAQHGVYLIPLAPIDHANGVTTALANVLGLQHYDNATDMQDNIIKYLQNKSILLIFDNFEHVLDAVDLLQAILTHAPKIKILVTSRQRLNLSGEVIFSLAGMDNQDEAIALFLQSAQRLRPDYELNEHDLSFIQDICRLVDGLPLGIELAAGWMDTLSPEQIASQISQSMDILETDLRDMPERHKSIQATFDYTWQALTESERASMMSLSLFPSGFTMEAAWAVCLADIRQIKRLLNKSLLYHHASGRYTIHELLRQFCFDKLLEHGNYDEVITAYMDYMATFAESQVVPMVAFDGNAYRTIRAEWDNLAFAWHKMLHYKRYDLIEQTYFSLWKFSAFQGHSYECVALFEPALDTLKSLADKDDALRLLYGNILGCYGDLLMGIKPHDIATDYLNRAIAILEQHPLARMLLDMYSNRLWLNKMKYSYNELFTHAQQLIDKATEFEFYPYVIDGYCALWDEEQYQQDTEAYQQSIQYCYDIWQKYLKDDVELHGTFVAGAVAMLLTLGEEGEAIDILNHQLRAYERAEWLYGITGVRSQLATIAFDTGRINDYQSQILATLEWHKQYGRDWQLIGTLGGFSSRGLYQLGAYHLCAEITAFVINHPIAVAMQKSEAHWVRNQVKSKLSQQELDTAWERGTQLTLEEAYTKAVTFWAQSATENITDAT